MLNKASARRDDLRNASVLEVIVAIIIVLVIFIYSNNLDFGDKIDALYASIKGLQNKNKQLEQENSELRASNLQLEKELKELRREAELLKKYVSASGDAGASIQELLDQVRNLTDENSMLKQQLAQALVKLKGSGMGGIDKPHCRLPVTDPNIRQEHRILGQISWSNQALTFSIDSNLDREKAALIPGVEILSSSKSLSLDDFRSAANMTWSHSRQLEPECRYVVEVLVDPSAEMPLSTMLTIERYFYKTIRML
jgi:uncharacterized protein YoxC